MELKEIINQAIGRKPVLEETTEEGEEITPEELQPLLEAERGAEPADQSLLDAAEIKLDGERPEISRNVTYLQTSKPRPKAPRRISAEAVDASTTDPSMRSIRSVFFDDYLIPAYRSPPPNPSTAFFRDFPFAAQTLPDYLRSQLSVAILDDEPRCGRDDHRQSR